MEELAGAQVFEMLKAIFGPGAVVVGVFVGIGLWKILPILVEMIIEVRLLRKDLEEVKKHGPRLDNHDGEIEYLKETTSSLKAHIFRT